LAFEIAYPAESLMVPSHPITSLLTRPVDWFSPAYGKALP
jgi:hypothetical protein